MEETWSYENAAAYARRLGISTSEEFTRWAAGNDPVRGPRPDGFPSNPHQAYPEWQGTSAFLGTNHVANFKREFLSYEEARAFVIKLGIQSHKEWNLYTTGKTGVFGAKPANIPSNPWSVYQEAGWRGIKHWLGTGVAVQAGRSRMVSYAEARAFVRKLKLRGLNDWRAYVKGEMKHLAPRPANIPATPNVTYRRRGWVGWGDFLGTGNLANFKREFLAFAEARRFVRSLKIGSSAEWRAWCRSEGTPDTIPANPEKSYAKQWRGWPDFLGTGARTSAKHRRTTRSRVASAASSVDQSTPKALN
jgi:hypothetical protein